MPPHHEIHGDTEPDEELGLDLSQWQQQQQQQQQRTRRRPASDPSEQSTAQRPRREGHPTPLNPAAAVGLAVLAVGAVLAAVSPSAAVSPHVGALQLRNYNPDVILRKVDGVYALTHFTSSAAMEWSAAYHSIANNSV